MKVSLQCMSREAAGESPTPGEISSLNLSCRVGGTSAKGSPTCLIGGGNGVSSIGKVDMSFSQSMTTWAPFRDGLAPFRIGELSAARFGYLKEKGVEVIPAVFRGADTFSEGLAGVKVGNLWAPFIHPISLRSRRISREPARARNQSRTHAPGISSTVWHRFG